MSALIDILLLAGLAVTALAVTRMRDLFGIAMLFGVFSLLSAAIFVVMDAVDVAMTEAAVGAGISTMLMLGTLAAVGRNEKPRPEKTATQRVIPVLVAVLTGAALLYGTWDMPDFGDPQAPAHQHPMADHFIRTSIEETHIPNMVTTLLASYRGFDTLGETAVVFTAGIGVIALLGGRRRRREDEEDEDSEAGSDAPAEAGP